MTKIFPNVSAYMDEFDNQVKKIRALVAKGRNEYLAAIDAANAQRAALKKRKTELPFENSSETRFINALADREGVSVTWLNQLKLTLRRLSDVQIEEMLDRCRATGYLPSMELLHTLAKVAAKTRQEMLEFAVEQDLTIRDLRFLVQTYNGIQSNGRRHPIPPRTTSDLNEQLNRTVARMRMILNAILDQNRPLLSIRGEQVVTPASLRVASEKHLREVTEFQAVYRQLKLDDLQA